MKLITTRTTDAIEFALQAHQGQIRKDGRPYIIHPLSVGMILQGAGYSEDVVIAGILHDIIEDTEFTKADIEQKFGASVANMVASVTEDFSIEDWNTRMDTYIETIKNSSDEVKAISLADRLDNRRHLLLGIEQDPDFWNKFKPKPEQIIEKTEKILEITSNINNEIIEELKEIVAKLKGII